MPRRITLCVISIFMSCAFADTGQKKVARSEAKEEAAKDKLDPETKLILESLSKRYEGLGNWEATFNQTEKSPGFAEEVSSEGFFKFVLPNKFLLVTRERAMIKKFVSNGTSAIYVEDKGPNAKKDRFFARQFADAKSLELERFLLFFRGLKKSGATQRDFKVTGKLKKPELEITLIPKAESDFSEITIKFPNAEGFPRELIFKDSLGGATDMRIIDPKSIPTVDPKWFDLTLPKGAKLEK